MLSELSLCTTILTKTFNGTFLIVCQNKQESLVALCFCLVILGTKRKKNNLIKSQQNLNNALVANIIHKNGQLIMEFECICVVTCFTHVALLLELMPLSTGKNGELWVTKVLQLWFSGGDFKHLLIVQGMTWPFRTASYNKFIQY